MAIRPANAKRTRFRGRVIYTSRTTVNCPSARAWCSVLYADWSFAELSCAEANLRRVSIVETGQRKGESASGGHLRGWFNVPGAEGTLT